MKIAKIEQKDKSKRKIYKLKHIKNFLIRKPLFLIFKKNKKLFEKYINKQIQQNESLLVPIDAILNYFDEDLNIIINPGYLKTTLKDWVSYDGGNIAHISHYFFIKGELSSIIRDMTTLSVYKEMVDLKSVNMDYKKSKTYENMIKRMESNRPIKRQQKLLNSFEAIDAYFDRFLNLYYSIKENGLKNHDEFQNDKENMAIGIAVYKDGTIIKLAGAQHRTSIAKILGLKKMPVQIRQIHKEYLDRIMNLYDIGYIDAILKIVYLTQEKYQE